MKRFNLEQWLIVAIFLLVQAMWAWAADYTESKKIDGLADVSAVDTTSTKIPAQDMNDTDKIGYTTIQSIIDLAWTDITAGDIPDISATYEVQLTNEAGLYAVLSDVTQFYEAGDAMASGVDDTTAGAIDIYGNNDATAGTLKFHNAANEDTTEEYFQMHVNDTNFWMGYVSDTDQFIFSNAGNFTASGNVAAATYGSDASITNAEFLFINTLSSNAQDQINGKQAADNDLTDIAALTPTDGNFMVGDGTDWVAESGATARASMGVTIGSQVQAYDAELDLLAAYSDPGADRIIFWDESANTFVSLVPGTGLSITGTSLDVSISSLDIGLTENYLLHGNGSNLAEPIAANALDFDILTTGTLNGRIPVSDDTTNNTVAKGEMNAFILDQDGDTWTLADIDAADGTGWSVCFYSDAANAVTVNPDDEDIIIDTFDDGGAESAGEAFTSDATAGNMICLVVIKFAGDVAYWAITSENGTWSPAD